MKDFVSSKLLVLLKAGVMLVLLPTLFACGGTPSSSPVQTTPAPRSPTSVPPAPTSTTYAPVINPADFVSVIDNPYRPWKPGTLIITEGMREGAKQHTEILVSHATKVILGVTCVVVRDRVFFNGQLEEDTTDWYAQDKEGNIWYFGEDSKDYKGGVVTTRLGSFEAGVDGAQPGILMRGHPEVGLIYRQEYYKGKAEDMAQVVKRGQTVTVPYGHFDNLIVTKEWTPLEPGKVEYKYYAAGVGWVLTTFEGSSDQEQLIKMTTDNPG